MKISKDMTVNQVIKLNPKVIPVFNTFNIDSCCGGSDTLEEAARKAKVDVESLIKEIEKAVEVE